MRSLLRAIFWMGICVLTICGVVSQGEAAWPDRPITVVIQYAAGGGTDIFTRAVVKEMEKGLGTTVNAINRPGAVGAMAMDYVFEKPADGYWWLGASQFSKPLRVMGYSKQSAWQQWQYYRCATEYMVWAVRADSPFKTIDDFLDAARKAPEKYSIANSGVGGLFHEGNILLEKAAGIKVRHVGYKGGAPSVLAALQGEVDVAGATVSEQIEFVRAGKMRTLAAFSKESVTLEGGIVLKAITEAVPKMALYAPYGGEYTIGVKRETPLEILEKIKQAFMVAVNGPDFEKLLKARYTFKAPLVGEEADRRAAQLECMTAWTLWDTKIEGVKVNPADLQIPRPEDFDRWWPPKDYKARLSNK